MAMADHEMLIRGDMSFADDQKRDDPPIQVNIPEDFEIDQYIAQYTGRTRVDRLLFIAERCPPLLVECLTRALEEIKSSSLDYRRYQDVAGLLHRTTGGGSSDIIDQNWVNSAANKARENTDKLEGELKNYQNNLIKESIRMGNNDIGDHYYKCGELQRALKSYLRSRDYCTSYKHVIDMCLNVIRVSIESGNYAHVQSYVIKAENTQGGDKDEDKSILTSKLHVASALAALQTGNFKLAAKLFLDVKPELGANYNEVISPSDIAIYGGLCALAAFDRGELVTKLIENVTFKTYLEYEPQIRDAVLSFHSSRYHACLEILEHQRKRLLLDVHLSAHINYICQEVRSRCLIQYISPFASVDLRRMAQNLAPKPLDSSAAPQVREQDVQALENEIVQLIKANKVQVRIDSQNKVLRAREQNQRSGVFQKSLNMANDYNKSQKNMLVRIRLTKADLVVDAPRNTNAENGRVLNETDADGFAIE